MCGGGIGEDISPTFLTDRVFTRSACFMQHLRKASCLADVIQKIGIRRFLRFVRRGDSRADFTFADPSGFQIIFLFFCFVN